MLNIHNVENISLRRLCPPETRRYHAKYNPNGASVREDSGRRCEDQKNLPTSLHRTNIHLSFHHSLLRVVSRGLQCENTPRTNFGRPNHHSCHVSGTLDRENKWVATTRPHHTDRIPPIIPPSFVNDGLQTSKTQSVNAHADLPCPRLLSALRNSSPATESLQKQIR